MSISVSKLEQMAQGATTFEAADGIYETILNHHLENNNFEAALKTAQKISLFSNADDALFSILRKAPQIAIKEAAADQMSLFSEQDAAYRAVFDAKLAKNDEEGAYNTVLKMSLFGTKDEALFELIKKTSNLALAEKALAQMSFYSQSEAAEQLINRFLDKKDFSKALNLLPLAGWLDRVEKLFCKIFEKMKEAALKKADLDLLLDSSKHLSPGKRKEVLQTLEDKYAALGEKSKVEEVTKELERLEKLEKEMQELLARVRPTALGALAFAFGFTYLTFLATFAVTAKLFACTNVLAKDFNFLYDGAAHVAGMAATAANGLLSAAAGVRA